jgi:hypothetical protein
VITLDFSMRIAPVVAALLCLTMPVFGVVFAAQTAKPSGNGVLVAVYPPWWPSSRALVAASEIGNVLNGNALPFVYVVQSTRTDFAERLRDSGAWVVMNPLGTDGCEPARGDENV